MGRATLAVLVVLVVAIQAAPVNVFIVPHSHCDAMWVETFDQYYKENVTAILTTVTDCMAANPSRKFNWAEIDFFSRWWEAQSPSKQAQVRQFVQEGRLEFLGGGWVQNDEAVTDFESVIDQMELGHDWLNATFGPSGRPRYAWQIDPFGASAASPSLFSQMGLEGLVIDRIDVYAKGSMVSEGAMEFVWRGTPQQYGTSADTITHVMGPFRYCTPSGFDFEGNSTENPPITPANVAARAEAFADVARSRVSMYATRNLLIPFGCDFRFQNASKMYDNMEALVSYINANQDQLQITAKFATLSEYFDALHASNSEFAVYKSDFFNYCTDWASDGGTRFWTGIYRSRPGNKRFLRAQNAVTRTAQRASAAAALSFDNQVPAADAKQLREAEEQLALMTHHDSDTGTSKWFVEADMTRRVSMAFNDSVAVLARSLERVMAGGAASVLDPEPTGALPMSVVVTNPLGFTRSEMLSVPLASGDRNVTVRDHAGQVVVANVAPVPVLSWFKRDSTATTTCRGPRYEKADKCDARAANNLPFEVFFPVTVPAVGATTYTIEYSAKKRVPSRRKRRKRRRRVAARGKPSGARAFERTFKPQEGLVGSDFIVIANKRVRVVFHADDLTLAFVQNLGGREVKMSQAFMRYGSTFSGAYIFSASGEATPVKSRVASAHLVNTTAYKRVVQTFDPPVPVAAQVWELFECASATGDEKCRSVHVTQLVGPLPNVTQTIITRYTTGISNDKGQLFSDDLGMQLVERPHVSGEEQVSVNYYAVISRARINDSATHLNVLVRETTGVSSQQEGELELMLHRYSTMDDCKGLNEALNDTSRIMASHQLLFASDVGRAPHVAQYPLLALYADRSKLSLPVVSQMSVASLPDGVRLLTLAIHNETAFVVRVMNFAQGGPVQSLDLADLFPQGTRIGTVEERTLTLLEDIGAWQAQRRARMWRLNGEELQRDGTLKKEEDEFVSLLSANTTGTNITLAPLQIRTFLVEASK